MGKDWFRSGMTTIRFGDMEDGNTERMTRVGRVSGTGGDVPMKTLKWFLIVTATALVAACGDYFEYADEPPVDAPPAVESEAPAAEDAASDAAETAPPEAPPPTLPTDPQDSNKSVQPDSETLFY